MTIPDLSPCPREPLHLGPFPRAERRVLSGRTVTLAPLDAARDTDSLFAALTAQDPSGKVWTYLPAAFGPGDRAGFGAYMAGHEQSEDPLFFSLLCPDTGACRGHASLMRITPQHGTIEIGWILFTPRLQRTVAATEGLALLMDYCLGDLGYRRLEWKCNALNQASRRAALRLGFSYEGTFRQHMLVKGQNRDSAWFSLLDHEWPARRARLWAWLDPANFDVNGQQRRSLSAIALEA